jgi:hypothetical protein
MFCAFRDCSPVCSGRLRLVIGPGSRRTRRCRGPRVLVPRSARSALRGASRSSGRCHAGAQPIPWGLPVRDEYVREDRDRSRLLDLVAQAPMRLPRTVRPRTAKLGLRGMISSLPPHPYAKALLGQATACHLRAAGRLVRYGTRTSPVRYRPDLRSGSFTANQLPALACASRRPGCWR